MKYKIIIKRTERNENYAEEKKAYKEDRRYNNSYPDDLPQPDKVLDVLETEITDEQFQAIRKSVLEQF